MKKKFSTLFSAAAFFLGTSVFAFASVPHTPFTSGAMVGSDASSLVNGANKGLYHIAEVDPSTGSAKGLLYVNNTNTASSGTVTIEAPSATRALGEALWCVEISTEAQGKNPSFAFINKAYGDNLRAEKTAVTSLILDGPLADWKFSNVYGKGVVLDKVKPLYSYINGSQAIVLVAGTGNRVKTVIANVADIEAAAATNSPTLGSETLLYFTLSEAAPIVLTANDFNTKLGTEPTATGQKLTFSPDKNVGNNPFTENVLSAQNVAGGTAGSANWYLNLKKGTQFLRVDTSLYNAAGNYFLDFKFTDTLEAGLQDQYAFRFVYFPSHDSLIINVKSALQPSKSREAAGLKFFSQYFGINNTVHGANEGELVSFDDVYSDTALVDFTYVILQDLNQNRVVTVGELPSQTHISLGLAGCQAAANKTSLQGLYTIKNKDGKYLQVPVYTDTTTTQIAKWVTVEKYVDINEMPSFQWVVEKIRTNDPDNSSQIKITNREYSTVSAGTIQLWNDKDNELIGTAIASGTEAFTEVGEKYRLDPYLGYKHIAADIAKLRTYTFNYLHDLDDSKYLSVKNDQKDSLLHVTDAKDAFELVPFYHYTTGNVKSVEPVKYGYTGTIKTIDGKAYAADLVRTAYVLKVKEGNKIYNTNKVVITDKEERYAVSSGDTGKNFIAKGDSAVFYLKTNNTKDGKNFYALIDTSSYTKGNAPMRTVKAGVADHNMWVKAQNHYEVRTSAFAVEPSESPLYRRFNRTTDGAIGSDSFYNGPAGSDNPDTLIIFRKNNEKEFLYEDRNSKNYSVEGISFLGVKHEADFSVTGNALASGTAFYVDTAFVARPAIASATEDTPKPQYLLGVAIKAIDSETIEENCAPDVTTPAYKRGRYLVNATDSVYGVGANWATNWSAAGGNVVKNSKYIWDTKWERLAFVDAIHMNDTLYVLNGQTYVDPIDVAELRADSKVRAIYLGNNFHKDVVFSFRLIDEEKDVDYKDQVQNFLIESETTNRNIATGEMIAPMNGGWVKIQNGVPVISRGDYSDAITDAERFNVVKTDANPVDNEDINVVDFKVIAGEGSVTILNAAGKSVVVNNILGQVVANTVLTSDNATIAAPKGIVVVAVDGKNAVKAIVK